MPVIVSMENTKSFIFNMAAPAIIGTDNINVNLVEAPLDIPKSLAANIVTPLLEKPGIIAND